MAEDDSEVLWYSMCTANSLVDWWTATYEDALESMMRAERARDAALEHWCEAAECVLCSVGDARRAAAVESRAAWAEYVGRIVACAGMQKVCKTVERQLIKALEAREGILATYRSTWNALETGKEAPE